ncbi:MAG: ECF transporter S component [Anaerolineae bacterium]
MYDERGIRRVVNAGLLLAITLLLAFTGIGFIPTPTPAGSATIAHIPAIIGGLLEGPLVGLIVGLGFGLASYARATIPALKDPLVAVLPRLFIGVTAAYTYLGLRKATKAQLRALLGVLLALVFFEAWQVYATPNESVTHPLLIAILIAAFGIALVGGLYVWLDRQDPRIAVVALAAAVGSLTNTVLVVTMASLRGYWSPGAALGIGITHGIPEVIVAAVIVIAVVAALRGIGQRKKSRVSQEPPELF